MAESLSVTALSALAVAAVLVEEARTMAAAEAVATKAWRRKVRDAQIALARAGVG